MEDMDRTVLPASSPPRRLGCRREKQCIRQLWCQATSGALCRFLPLLALGHRLRESTVLKAFTLAQALLQMLFVVGILSGTFFALPSMRLGCGTRYSFAILQTPYFEAVYDFFRSYGIKFAAFRIFEPPQPTAESRLS